MCIEHDDLYVEKPLIGLRSPAQKPQVTKNVYRQCINDKNEYTSRAMAASTKYVCESIQPREK